MSKIGKSGVKYILWDKQYGGNWIVKPKINGEYVYLGKFKDLDKAKEKLSEVIGDISNLPNGEKHSLNIDYFKSIDSPRKAFWLGFICADGYIDIKNGRLRVSQKDKYLIELLKNDIEYSGDITTKKNVKGRYSDKEHYELNISRRNFVDDIVKCGKAKLKSEQESIPKSVPEEFVIDFIRGYFEGDGTVYLDGKNIVVRISGYEDLIKDIQNHIQGTIHDDKNIKYLQIRGNDNVRKFYELIHCDNDIGVKANKLEGLLKNG